MDALLFCFLLLWDYSAWQRMLEQSWKYLEVLELDHMLAL